MNLARLSQCLPEFNRNVWWVIVVNAAMQVIFNFVAIFVNLYWWNQGNPIYVVSFFNLYATVALFASYGLGSYFLWRKDIRFVMLLSAVFAGLSFLGLFFYLTDLRVIFTVGIGLCFGSTQGFFWAANNSSMYTVLPSDQWADYFSMNTVIGQVIAVAIPLASAGAVVWLGFRGSFLAMLVFVLAALAVSMRLPHRGLSENLFSHIRYQEVFSRPGTPWILAVVLASGIVNQFLTLFSMIYIFTVSTQVGVVAILNIGYSVALFGALILYRRSSWTQDTWIMMGIALILASYGLVFTMGPGSVITLVVLLMRVGGLYLSAASGRQRYRVMMQGDVLWRTRLGLWMEIPFVLSRVGILVGALFVRSLSGIHFIVLMLVSTAALVLLPVLTRIAVGRFEAVHGVGAGL